MSTAAALLPTSRLPLQMTLLRRHGALHRHPPLRRVAIRAMFGMTLFAATTGAAPSHASAAAPAAVVTPAAQH